MAYTKFYSIVFIFSCIFLGLAISAFAVITPTLSLSSLNDNDNVQVTVSGDPNASVLFYYTKTNVGPQMISLGTTNSSGSFAQTISSSAQGIPSNGMVHVVLGGINGVSSPEVSWPVVNSTATTGTTITLSQTGIVLNVGGSANITVNNNTQSLYLSNNSNPAVANLSLSNASITVNANASGSTIATVCVVGNSSNCASIYITVQNSGTSALAFSINNIAIASGANAPVTITGGTGTYYVLSNSNSSVISASINGSVITLTANASTGSASITVCSTNMSSCGIVNASAGSTSSSYLSFSSTNPTMSAGSDTTVTISGTSGATYYISNNSNSGVVTATISNNVITLHGVVNGSSVITVCSSLGTCGSLTAVVSYTSSGGNIMLSQTTLSLLMGQAVSITITGGTTPYNLPTVSNGIYQASLNSNVLTVYGISAGTSIMPVCSSEGGCTTLSVTVTSSTGTTNTSAPSFNQNNISLTTGTNTTVSVYGTGNFFIFSNSNTSVANATLNGSTIAISGLTAGLANVSVCQGSSAYCSVLSITVANITPIPAPVVTPTVATENYFVLNRYLGAGDNGDDVLNMQKVLSNLGFLSANPNGHYGPATVSAIKKFQKQYGIRQTGNIGTATKNAIEVLKIKISGTASGEDQVTKLQAMITALTAQINALKR